MLTVKEDTAIIGVAELRSKAANVLKEIKKHKIILTKRNRPVGIYGEYEKMEQLLEEVEDIILGNIALERLERKDKKTMTLEQAERKVGLR